MAMKTKIAHDARPPYKVKLNYVRHRVVRRSLGGFLATGRPLGYNTVEEAQNVARETKRLGSKHVWIVTENIQVLAVTEA